MSEAITLLLLINYIDSVKALFILIISLWTESFLTPLGVLHLFTKRTLNNVLFLSKCDAFLWYFYSLLFLLIYIKI